MFQTLYYTYGQGSLLLGSVHLRGIGHERQGCDSNTIDYPQPCVHLAVPTCVIHQPDSAPCVQPNDPFCFSEYIRGYQNRFLFLANMSGGNPRPERVFVYAPWGMFYPIAYYANRFISGQYKDVVKVKFEDIFNHNIWCRYMQGILYLVVWCVPSVIVTKLLTVVT